MKHPSNACPRMLQYRPPRIAMSLLATAALLQLLAPFARHTLPPFVLAGALVTTLGFAVMLRGWWLFRQRETAICPTAEATTLITDDVYAWTRNPMYLGITLMLLGVAVATGGLFFYLAAIGFFLIIDVVFCPFEERRLAATFGDRFERYRDRVRRWL